MVPFYSGVNEASLNAATTLLLKSGVDSPKPTQMLYASRLQQGLQWPVTEEHPRGTPRLYQDGFPMGRANLVTPEFRLADAVADDNYPMWLAPGRVLLQRDRQTQIQTDATTKRNRNRPPGIGRTQSLRRRIHGAGCRRPGGGGDQKFQYGRNSRLEPIRAKGGHFGNHPLRANGGGLGELPRTRSDVPCAGTAS